MKKNLVWAGLLRGVNRGLTFIKTLVLARLLIPSQFGVFGIGLLVLGLLEMLTETGVNIVLVQEKKNIDRYINTAWVVSILRGITISILIIVTAKFVANFFNNPAAVTILYLTAAVPFVRGFINPSIVKYQKDFEFNKEFWFKSFLVVIDVVVSVVFAIIYRSELALILGMLVSALVEVFASFILVGPKPKFEFNKQKLLRVFDKGKWITGAKIFDYLFAHGDDIVVGRLLGSASLGIYQQAYRISSLPIVEVAEVFQRVTFPYLAKNSQDREQIIKIYSKSLLGILLFAVPVGVLLFVFPYHIVNFLLGSNWLDAVPVLRVLAIFAIVKTVANSVFPVFLGINRQDLVAGLTLAGIVGLGISIYPLVSNYGLVGAATAAVIGSLVMVPPGIYWLRKEVLLTKKQND